MPSEGEEEDHEVVVAAQAPKEVLHHKDHQVLSMVVPGNHNNAQKPNRHNQIEVAIPGKSRAIIKATPIGKDQVRSQQLLTEAIRLDRSPAPAREAVETRRNLALLTEKLILTEVETIIRILQQETEIHQQETEILVETEEILTVVILMLISG